jgi:hypothetical protein
MLMVAMGARRSRIHIYFPGASGLGIHEAIPLVCSIRGGGLKMSVNIKSKQ